MKKSFLMLGIRSLVLYVMAILLAFGVVKQTYALDILKSEVWSGEGGNSHHYLVVQFDGWNTTEPIDWNTANNLVATLGDYHLATITTVEEQNWIANTLMSGILYEYWIGAYQDPIDTLEANANWRWVTEESWSFAAWYSGEPNDYWGPGAEQWAAIWDIDNWEWNDEQPNSRWNIRGFIAESTNPVGSPANLEVIGTAEYSGGSYKLIYEKAKGLVWLDYTNNDYWLLQDAWVAGLGGNLTVNLYPRYTTTIDWSTGWRLPKALEGPFTDGYDGTTTAGYNITTSEMGYLFYTELENKGYYAIDGTHPQDGWGLANKGPFTNLQASIYWSGTGLPFDPYYSTDVWYFSFSDGRQWWATKYQDEYSAMAVHPGVVDRLLPETSITSALDGNGMAVTSGGTTTSDSITFTFAGTDAFPDVTFMCSLDGVSFVTCTSPATYSSLSFGDHSFDVRAVDEVENLDPTPAQFIWTVITPAEGIGEVIDQITETLPPSDASSLAGPLDNAEEKLTDGNTQNDAAACNDLNAFINQVNAKLKAGKLTAEQAASLIQSAEAIRAAQGCP